MRGRCLVAMALLLVLTGCTMWREKRPATWSSATGPETFERLLWQDIAAGNWSEVEKHLAPAFTATLPGGRYDREGTIALWKQQPREPMSLGEFTVTPQGNSTVVTYTAQAAGQNTRWRMMTVWQEASGGDWMAIAHSEVPESAAEAAPLPKM
jgi:hypothetical protein